MAALKNLFSGIQMPKIPQPVKMPDLQDPALIEQRKQQLAKLNDTGGRQSTIMSESLMGSAGKLGG